MRKRVIIAVIVALVAILLSKVTGVVEASVVSTFVVIGLDTIQLMLRGKAGGDYKIEELEDTVIGVVVGLVTVLCYSVVCGM